MPESPPDSTPDTASRRPESSRLAEVASLFFKMGCTAFGGPAAHIAIMQEEAIDRRGWISRQQFLDLIAATNLIPGPNSTEMAMHLGHERAGLPGMVVAGAAFIAPAVVITGILAWIYVAFGTRPEVAAALYCVKPVVIVIIAAAAWKLGKKAIKGVECGMIAVATAAMVFAGLPAIVALLIGAVVGTIWLRTQARPTDKAEPNGAGGASKRGASGVAALPVVGAVGSVGAGAAAASWWSVGLVFLKVGAILYGSGYVLVSFLEDELVRGRGWLDQAQLLDAIAIGQFTPGPVLSTATFIGYVIAGPLGAIAATIGIFLPSFAFVAVLNPIVPRLRKSAWTAAFLDAVGAAAVALLGVVAARFCIALGFDWKAWAIVAVTAYLFFGRRVKGTWLIGGAVVLGIVGALLDLW